MTHYWFDRLNTWLNIQRAMLSLQAIPVGAGLILGGFVFLASLYSVTTPLFETPDEVWHFRFITHVADTGSLPVVNPARPGPWRQEGTQPPLYYLLAATLVAPIDTQDVEEVIQLNPHAAVGRAGVDGNVNFIVHTSHERFPWRQTVLAAHLVRFLSVLLGMLTVAFTYLLAKETHRQSLHRSPHLLALGAALLVAFNPQFLFISGAINNDNLVVAFSTGTLFHLLRLANRGFSDRRLMILGLLLGLAALSKLSGLGLWPLAALVLLVCGLRQQAGPSHGSRSANLLGLARALILVFGTAIAVAGWWYVRNWVLYGDPTALNVHLGVFGHRVGPVSPFQLLRELQGLRWSFWGVFGWFNVLPPRWVHQFFDLIMLLGGIGSLIFLSQRIRARDWATTGRLLLLLGHFSITVLSLGRWTMLTSASQGRLLFPAIGAISTILFTGLATWIPARYLPRVLPLLGSGMAGLALYIALGVIKPAYAPPPTLPADQIAAIPHLLPNTIFGDQIALRGYQVTPDIIQPRDELTVTLYWQALKPIQKNYSLFIHLVGENDVILAQRDSFPGRGNAPTSEWVPGVVYKDRYRLQVPSTIGTPQSAWVAVGLYDLQTQRRLSLSDGTDRFPLKSVQAIPAQGAGGIPNPLEFNLNNQVKLVGYELNRRVARPGETIELVLYWQAINLINRNYTVFTQLLDDNFRIWAQDDSQPLRGDYPTSRWAPGEIVRDPHHLEIHPEAPAGVYHLEIGMYLLKTGERLYRTDNPLANSIRLADIRILPKN